MSIINNTHLVNQEHLQRVYQQATPFNHLTIDQLWDNAFLELFEFPPSSEEMVFLWHEWRTENKACLTFNRWQDMTYCLAEAFNKLTSSDVINFLGTLTGIEGLIPDRFLIGSGMKRMRMGGFERVHQDMNILNVDTEFYLKRIKMVIFFNRFWESSWGGSFELWNETRREEVITPVWNRTVIMDALDTWHGSPQPINTPSTALSRDSVEVSFYTEMTREQIETIDPHSTIYRP